MRHEDRDRLIRFYTRLSREALYARFFGARTPEAAAACSPVDVDYRREFGVVGELAGEIVAVAHYFASAKHPDIAERHVDRTTTPKARESGSCVWIHRAERQKPDTRSHIENILEKLEVHSKAEAVSFATMKRV